MSIAGIGSYGSGGISQILSSLFTKLDSTSTTSTTDSTSNQSTTTTTAAADGSLTGSTKPSLSSMILGVLMELQHQSSTSSSSSEDGSSATSDADATATGSSNPNPVSDLFSAMDADTDGSVTQSELESYIESVGGTAEDADSLYSLLNTSDSTDGISEEDLASQAPPPPPPGGGPGGPGGPPPSDSTSSSTGSELVDALDTDSDGTVSQSELTDYITANGGTESDAETLFSSLVTDGESSISSSNFDAAIENMATSFSTNPYASILDMLSVFNTSSTNSSGSSVSVSA